jgi:ribose transport system substrate-binding protein
MPPTGKLLGSLCVALSLFCCGCSSGRNSAATSEDRYFLLTVNTQVPYWQTAGAGFGKAAAALGVQGTVAGPGSYDPKAEQEEFRRVVGSNPAGILVSPADPELMRADIDAAIASGSPVITVDADAAASKRLVFIGTDNYEAGRMGGEFVSRSLHGSGNVMIFSMPEQTNLNERYRG